MPNQKHNRYYFTGRIRLTSALHIGGGNIHELNTNNPLVRTPAGQPFIPGSSLKGVFRSFVEKVVQGIDGVDSCQLNEDYQNCFSVNDGLIKWKEDIKKENKKITENQLGEVLEKNLCDVCKTFGSPWRASKVFFMDCHIEEWAEITQIRDGVVIDRDSETGVKGLKYDFEVIPTDTLFSFTLSLENVNPIDLGLVALGLNEMLSGLMQLGGNTSRGTGNFILEDLKGYETDFHNEDHLKKYLRNRDIEKKMNLLAIENFLDDKINGLFPKEDE